MFNYNPVYVLRSVFLFLVATFESSLLINCDYGNTVLTTPLYRKWVWLNSPSFPGHWTTSFALWPLSSSAVCVGGRCGWWTALPGSSIRWPLLLQVNNYYVLLASNIIMRTLICKSSHNIVNCNIVLVYLLYMTSRSCLIAKVRTQ